MGFAGKKSKFEFNGTITKAPRWVFLVLQLKLTTFVYIHGTIIIIIISSSNPK